MGQLRVPGTLPAPEEARKRHKEAVRIVRQLRADLEIAKESAAELRKSLRKAVKAVEACEDDLDAIEDARRPDR